MLITINIKSREICLERDCLGWTTALKIGEKVCAGVCACLTHKHQ